MIEDREWVAFSALEKALKTAKPLSTSQRLRHAWIELMVAEQLFIKTVIKKADQAFPTTVLMLNKGNPTVVAFSLYRDNVLINLIVIIDDYLKRNSHNSLSISKLLEFLTTATTRIEARATLESARNLEIVQLDTTKSDHPLSYKVATITLNYDHAFVQETLTKRNNIIRLIDQLLLNQTPQRDGLGLTEAMLLNKLEETWEIDRITSYFWVYLLLRENILSIITFVISPKESIRLLHLVDSDPIVRNALIEQS